MSSAPNLRIVPTSRGPHPRPLLTLADFPIGSLSGLSLHAYRTDSTGRLHFSRDCSALFRSKGFQAETVLLPPRGSLADLRLPDACCGPPGEFGSYLAVARRLCEMAEHLPSLAQALGVRQDELDRGRNASDYNGREVDWQSLCDLWRVLDQLIKVNSPGLDGLTKGLSDEFAAVVRDNAHRLAPLASKIYNRALLQARGWPGQRSIGRMLAARCVLNGRVPAKYAAIYQEFRDAVARSLRPLEGAFGRKGAQFAEFLAESGRFDIARRWAEDMEDTGDPAKAAAALAEDMMLVDALKEPAFEKMHEVALQLVESAAIGYLDGLCIRGQEPMLVLAAADASPFTTGNAVDPVQWDIFPSADCLLHGERLGDSGEDTRVAMVPRLWTDALREPGRPHLRGEFLVLAYELKPLSDPTYLCSEVAETISRSCHAGVLSHDEWSATTRSRFAGERLAREAAESVFARLGMMR